MFNFWSHCALGGVLGLLTIVKLSSFLCPGTIDNNQRLIIFILRMGVFQDVKAGGSASHKSIDETMAWNSAASENAAGCFSCRIEVRDDLVFVV